MSNRVTFNVANVKPSSDRLPTFTAKKAMEKLVETPVEAICRPNDLVVQGQGFHPFFEAVHLAFANHYPLVLKPDYFHILMNQGFATAVNQNPERYRGSFVKFEGKQTISIYRPDFTAGSPNNDWPSCFQQFADAIKGYIGEENHDRFVVGYSTTGPVSKVVSQITLMDVVQSFFTYVVWTECGIPSITLEGTVEDWKKLRAHADGLRTYGNELDFWLDALVPILDKLVEAASGKADVAFFNDIYKTGGGSGSQTISGWIAKFLPYTKARYGDEKVQNPILTGEAQAIDTSELPAGVSTVPFLFDSAPYQFIAGHFAVVQEKDGSVRPALGWAVRPNPNPPADNTPAPVSQPEPTTSDDTDGGYEPVGGPEPVGGRGGFEPITRDDGGCLERMGG